MTAWIRPRVRFWAFVNGSPVRITLDHDQTLRWHRCEPTDEGYSWEAEEWHFYRDKVYSTVQRGGRDCDGELMRLSEWECRVDRLESFSPGTLDGVRFPDWEEVSSSQRDQYAELMGY